MTTPSVVTFVTFVEPTTPMKLELKMSQKHPLGA